MTAAGTLERSRPDAVTDPTPAWLRHGPLAVHGGVVVVPGLPDVTACQLLAVEARQVYPSASRQVCDVPTLVDGRGGAPRRALTSAGGGNAQDAVYASAWLHRYLSELCGGTVRPSGNRGSYSYYVEHGDHLDLHLDIVTCDVTVITVLADSTAPDSPGGALVVRRRSVGIPLGELRAGGHGDDEEVVKAPPGHSVVILGGIVPHRVEPIAGPGQRVISALCFQALPDLSASRSG